MSERTDASEWVKVKRLHTSGGCVFKLSEVVSIDFVSLNAHGCTQFDVSLSSGTELAFRNDTYDVSKLEKIYEELSGGY